MSQGELPYEVRALLHRALPSMVHVEAVLLLAKSPSESFRPDAVAPRIGSTTDVVAAALADLVAVKLAEQTPGVASPEFRFAATDVSVVNAVATLQEMYDRRPVTLVKAVYDRPPSAVKAFADAFRVRPKGEG